MALSGTVAFRPNVEEIIAESFERCGIDHRQELAIMHDLQEEALIYYSQNFPIEV